MNILCDALRKKVNKNEQISEKKKFLDIKETKLK